MYNVNCYEVKFQKKKKLKIVSQVNRKLKIKLLLLYSRNENNDGLSRPELPRVVASNCLLLRIELVTNIKLCLQRLRRMVNTKIQVIWIRDQSGMMKKHSAFSVQKEMKLFFTPLCCHHII